MKSSVAENERSAHMFPPGFAALAAKLKTNDSVRKILLVCCGLWEAKYERHHRRPHRLRRKDRTTGFRSVHSLQFMFRLAAV